MINNDVNSVQKYKIPMKSPNLFDKNVYIFSSKRPNLCEIRPLVRFTKYHFAVHLI